MTMTTPKILLFDDYSQTFTWMEDRYGEENVILTDRIADAIRAFHNDKPTLIVSDICAGGPAATMRHEGMAPQWTGLDFIHEIREHNQDIPIIAYTGTWDAVLLRILEHYKATWIVKDDYQTFKETLDDHMRR